MLVKVMSVRVWAVERCCWHVGDNATGMILMRKGSLAAGVVTVVEVLLWWAGLACQHPSSRD